MLVRLPCWVAGILLTSVCGPAGGAASDSLPDTINAFQRAAVSIRSFDVYVRIDRAWPLKAVIVERTKDGKPLAAEWRDRAPGEPPKKETLLMRQVLGPNGERRSALLDRDGKTWEKTFDGEVTRFLDVRKRDAWLDGPADLNFIEFGLDYLMLYESRTRDGTLAEVLRSRNGTRLAAAGPEDLGMAVVEAPPHQATDIGFRVALDPSHGMLPSRIIRSPHGSRDEGSETRVTMYREVKAGLWVPVKAAATFGPPNRPSYVVEFEVDVARSRWNEPLSADTFALPIPEGIRVKDFRRGVAFISGEGDTGKEIDRLVENAREVFVFGERGKAPGFAPAPRRPFLLGLLVGIHVVCLAVIYLFLRLRGKSSKGVGP